MKQIRAAHETQEILRGLNPQTPQGADAILDLRDALMSRGHPGVCVKCFFGLLGDLGVKGALRPLQHWLETHVEVAVSGDGQELETMPVRLDGAVDLEEYCEKTMRMVREDRAYPQREIALRLRFKSLATLGSIAG